LVVVSAGDEQCAYVIFGSRLVAVWQLFNIDILELDQAGRTAPDALFVLSAMMLEGEASAIGKIGNGGPGNDRLSVQRNLDRFPLPVDLELFPFAARRVGWGGGRTGRRRVGRCLRVGADAI